MSIEQVCRDIRV